jgi:hypothetical protein
MLYYASRFLLAVSLLVVLSCTKTSPGIDQAKNTTGIATITGRLNRTGLAKSKATMTFDRIWATPLPGGNVTAISSLLGSSKLCDIDSAGNFALDINKSFGNYLLLLIDSKQTDKTMQVQGYVTVGMGDACMLRLPIDKMSGDSLNLGNLNNSTHPEEFASDTSLSQQFTLSAEDLLRIARNDESLRAIKNVYLNYNPADGSYIAMTPTFRWNAAYIPAITNTYYDPTLIASAVKMYYFGITDTNLAFDSSTVSLEAPGPVSLLLNLLDGTKENLGTSVGGNYFLFGPNKNSCESPYFTDAIPAGYWTLKVSGQQVAVFDIGCAYQTDSMGLPKIFIPAPRLTIGSDSIVTAVDIKWYGYSHNGYEEISDPQLLASMIQGKVGVGLNNYTHSINDNTSYEIGPISIGSLSHSWAVGADHSASSFILEEVTIDYQMNGLFYRLNFKAREDLYGK